MIVHPDFLDFVRCLKGRDVEFVLIGAFAVAFHGRPRSTGDMDVWIRPTKENAAKVIGALKDFGFGSLAIGEDDLLSDKVIQLGRAPIRIDILSGLTGVTTEEIWTGRQEGDFDAVRVFYMGRATLIKNKRATGRTRDLADAEDLGG